MTPQNLQPRRVTPVQMLALPRRVAKRTSVAPPRRDFLKQALRRAVDQGEVPPVLAWGAQLDEAGIRGGSLPTKGVKRMAEHAWTYHAYSMFQTSAAGVLAGVDLTLANPFGDPVTSMLLVPAVELRITAPRERVQPIPFTVEITEAYGETAHQSFDLDGHVWKYTMVKPNAHVLILGHNLVNCQPVPQAMAVTHNWPGSGGAGTYVEHDRNIVVRVTGLNSDYTLTLRAITEVSDIAGRLMSLL